VSQVVGTCPLQELDLSHDARFHPDTLFLHFLYAANDFDSNITTFEIERDGALETVPGSPFATGTVENCAGSANVVCEGIPLAASPHGKYLFAGHPGVSTIFPGSSESYAYRIGHDGALVPVPGSPFNSGGPNPTYLKVTADGHTLLALLETPTSTEGSTNQIAVFRIGEHGVLTQVAGSPFSIGNDAAALDISCKGEVYVAEVDQIEILKLAWNGQLTAAPSSPVFPKTNGAVGDIQLRLSRTVWTAKPSRHAAFHCRFKEREAGGSCPSPAAPGAA
jgi:hypothetical protein